MHSECRENFCTSNNSIILSLATVDPIVVLAIFFSQLDTKLTATVCRWSMWCMSCALKNFGKASVNVRPTIQHVIVFNELYRLFVQVVLSNQQLTMVASSSHRFKFSSSAHELSETHASATRQRQLTGSLLCLARIDLASSALVCHISQFKAATCRNPQL